MPKELFRQYTGAGRMLLSTQAVQEFYAASSRKLGMPRRELRDATAAERLFIGRTLGGLPGRADDADAGTSHMTCNPLWRGTYSFALKIPVAALDPCRTLLRWDIDGRQGAKYGLRSVRLLPRSPGKSAKKPT